MKTRLHLLQLQPPQRLFQHHSKCFPSQRPRRTGTLSLNEELSLDPCNHSKATASELVLCRLLVVAKQAAQTSVEEDDYDADEDAQAHVQPSAPALQPTPIIKSPAAQAVAHQAGSAQV